MNANACYNCLYKSFKGISKEYVQIVVNLVDKRARVSYIFILPIKGFYKYGKMVGQFTTIGNGCTEQRTELAKHRIPFFQTEFRAKR